MARRALIILLAALLCSALANGQRACVKFDLMQKLRPPYAYDGTRSLFGSYVKVTQEHLAVGAYAYQGFRGAAFMYRPAGDGGAWTYQQKVQPRDVAENDNLTWELDIFNASMIAGSVYKRTSQASKSGRAYIFEYETGRWTEKQQLIAPDGQANDVLGYSVAISAAYAMAGAEQGKKTTGRRAGAVYVFRRQPGGLWSNVQILRGNAPGDQFGDDIEVVGDVMVVGSPFAESAGTEPNSGAAFTYALDERGMWTRTAQLNPPMSRTDSEYGTACSLDSSGGSAVCGSSGNGPPNTVYAYERTGRRWSQVQALVPSPPEGQQNFGYRQSIYGNVLIVNAPRRSVNGVSMAGSAFVFAKCNGSNLYSQQATLTMPHPAAGDLFGLVTSQTNDVAVIPCPRRDPAGKGATADYGLVRIYRVRHM